MKKTTITIGIPLYNEAQNIKHLLQSIIEQRCLSFKLQKIHIICDGSSDSTPDIVKTLQSKHPLITFTIYKHRLGKTARLNELYQANKADYLLTLDGDIVLGTSMEIEKVLTVARETKASVVAAHQMPNKISGFVGRISYANHILWTGVRVRVNGGNYIQNLQGAATLIKREFVRRLHYPIGIVCDQRYLYIKAASKNTFAFSPNSEVIYQPLSTLSDWNRLNRRLMSENVYLHMLFGKNIKELYEPPFKCKLQGVFAAFRKDPFFSLLALGMCYVFKFIMPFQKPDVNGLWPTLTSTKTAIETNKVTYKKSLLMFTPVGLNHSSFVLHWFVGIYQSFYAHLLHAIFRKVVIRI